jgi:hypothetical protein
MSGLDRVELSRGKPEGLRNRCEELFLLPMHVLVGLGDMEEAIVHALKQLAIAVEYCDELLGVDFKIGSVPLRGIEDWRGARFISAPDTLNASLKALTSSAATMPSALAILALSTITPTVKGTSLSRSARCLRS